MEQPEPPPNEPGDAEHISSDGDTGELKGLAPQPLSLDETFKPTEDQTAENHDITAGNPDKLDAADEDPSWESKGDTKSNANVNISWSMPSSRRSSIGTRGSQAGAQSERKKHDRESGNNSDSDSDSDSIFSHFTEEELVEDEEKFTKAEECFARKNGVVYVSDDRFNSMSPWARHCHIYVSAYDDEKHAKGQKRATTTPRVAKGPSFTDMSSRAIPPRMTILNELLAKDLSLNGITDGVEFNYHLAPYRILVLREKQILDRHRELETSFADLSLNHSDHRAVLRNQEFLHYKDAYKVKRFWLSSDLDTSDGVDKARALLDGYRALVQFLETDLQDLLVGCQNIRDMSVNSLPFPHLWFMFAIYPTMPIVAGNQAYRVLRVRGGRATTADGLRADENCDFQGVSETRWKWSILEFDCFSIDFDGKEFGPVRHKVEIVPYDGLKQIKNLPAYPIGFNTDRVACTGTLAGSGESDLSFSDMLHRRGQSFEIIAQSSQGSHWRYKGLSLREPGSFNVREEIDSDVMVDLEMAYRTEANIQIPKFGQDLAVQSVYEQRESGLRAHRDSHYIFECALRLEALWEDSVESELLEIQKPGLLNPKAYMILSTRIYGYVLFRRKWYPLSMDLLTKVPPTEPGANDGFEKLVLPRGHKRIVRALVNTHTRKLDADAGLSMANPQRDFDLVKGKGRGLIILLHGAPGVGKTSTAECVAANAGRPLFHITCGDIGGNSAQEVEANLDRFFDLAGRWNCVLLLDEADVFLSSRQAGNIKQNSLVSVFLRVLEYYPGILILTTNRVGNFDEAIKSRVHCALYYPPLDEKQTYLVWKRNLEALKERNEALESNIRVRFKKSDIEDFARWHWEDCERHERWNGRQIKNAFQTAVALSEWRMLQRVNKGVSPRGPKLTWEDFETVAIASKHFDRYLEHVRSEDEAIARQDQLREDAITSAIPNHKNGSKSNKSTKGKPSVRRPARRRRRGRDVSETDEDEDEDSEEETDEDASETDSDDDDAEDDGNGTEDGSEDDDEAEESSSESEREMKKKHKKTKKAKKVKQTVQKETSSRKTRRAMKIDKDKAGAVSEKDVTRESDGQDSLQDDGDERPAKKKGKKASSGGGKKESRRKE